MHRGEVVLVDEFAVVEGYPVGRWQPGDVFTDQVLHDLDIFGHLTSLTAISELSSIRTQEASVRTAADIVHHKDVDTGAHLDRMANFARLIARTIASTYSLTDDLIDHIFLFAPLHDIGKIAIPDEILRKPAPSPTRSAPSCAAIPPKGGRSST